jgi:hypothetical protein
LVWTSVASAAKKCTAMSPLFSPWCVMVLVPPAPRGHRHLRYKHWKVSSIICFISLVLLKLLEPGDCKIVGKKMFRSRHSYMLLKYNNSLFACASRVGIRYMRLPSFMHIHVMSFLNMSCFLCGTIYFPLIPNSTYLRSSIGWDVSYCWAQQSTP